MKDSRFSSLLLVLSLLVTIIGCAEAAGCNSFGPWVRLADSPHMGTEGSTVEYNGKLYCLGGFTDAGLSATETVSVFDPVGNQWTSAAPMPSAALTHFQAVSDGQFVYVVGGFQGDYPGPPIAAAHKYDLAADKWSSLPSLPEARAGGALAIILSQRNTPAQTVDLWYLSGLIDYHNDSDLIFKLRVGDANWNVAAERFIDPKNHFLVRQIGDTLYAPGGQHHYEPGGSDVNGFAIGTLNAQNDAADWKVGARLPAQRSHSEVLVINDRLVLFGGRNNQATKQIYDDIIEFDPFANQWNTVGQLPVQLISPFGGFFRNIAINGVTGDYVIITKGGLDWNIPLNGTYASRVSSTCTPITTKPPITAPQTTATSTTQSQTTSSSSTPTVSATPTGTGSATPTSTVSTTTATATQKQNADNTLSQAPTTPQGNSSSATRLQDSLKLLSFAVAICFVIIVW